MRELRSRVHKCSQCGIQVTAFGLLSGWSSSEIHLIFYARSSVSRVFEVIISYKP